MIPKYRAWHKPMQRMSEVLAISYERQKVKIRHLRGTTHMTVPFDDVELMQSTGLVDKNGQEIFEGDVIGWWYSEGDLISQRGYMVVCNNGAFRPDKSSEEKLYDLLEDCGYAWYQVIGNVYQNQELVEGDGCIK